MPRALIELMHSLYDRWRFATPADFLMLAAMIVAVGWLVARLSAES